MRKLPTLLVLLLVAGCAAQGGAGYGGGGDDDDDDGVVGDDDDDDGAQPTPTMPAIIDIAATDEMLALPFEVDVAGSATGTTGDVSVADNAGTIELDGGATAAAFYEKQPWTDFGYTLYQGVAVGSTSLDVVWLYCEDGTDLSYVWREGVNGPALAYLDATGTCGGSDALTSTSVTFPALSIDVPATVPGYTIDGAEITLADGETGYLTIGGAPFPFVVFEDVDCTACGGDGWYELHSLLWDHAAQRTIFVIFYLDFAYPDRVLAAYARSLPDFDDPIGTLELDAAWTAQPGVGTTVRTAIPRLRP